MCENIFHMLLFSSFFSKGEIQCGGMQNNLDIFIGVSMLSIRPAGIIP